MNKIRIEKDKKILQPASRKETYHNIVIILHIFGVCSIRVFWEDAF